MKQLALEYIEKSLAPSKQSCRRAALFRAPHTLRTLSPPAPEGARDAMQMSARLIVCRRRQRSAPHKDAPPKMADWRATNKGT